MHHRGTDRTKLITIFLCELIDDGRNHAARTAPRSPEVHEHRHRGLENHFFPCVVINSSSTCREQTVREIRLASWPDVWNKQQKVRCQNFKRRPAVVPAVEPSAFARTIRCNSFTKRDFTVTGWRAATRLGCKPPFRDAKHFTGTMAPVIMVAAIAKPSRG